MEVLSAQPERLTLFLSRRELIAAINTLQNMLDPRNVAEFSCLVGATLKEGEVLLENLQWVLGRLESVRLRRKVRRTVNPDLPADLRFDVVEIRPAGALFVISEDQLNPKQPLRIHAFPIHSPHA